MAIVRRTGGFTRRRTFGRGGNQLRPVEWTRNVSTGGTINPGGVMEIELVPGTTFEDYTRPTVVRVIGDLWVYAGSIELGNFAFGAAGITLLNPTEGPVCPQGFASGQRWMWWTGLHLILVEQPTGTFNLVDEISSKRFHFDVRAMRKATTDGNRLSLLVDNMADSTANMTGYASWSVLVKE
jgi:hypothetical protein